MYAREINNRTFTFGVSGKLIRNVLVMYDRQTDSYWSQLLGEAVEGPMLGTKLEFLPSWMMSWQAWKELHPDTVALDKGGRAGSRDVYESYYRSGAAGVIGETLSDDRLHTKEFVVGVEHGDLAIAYPFSALNETPMVNDTLADLELLIIFDVETSASVVFDRRLGGELLTFATGGTPHVIKDNETGSTWDAFSGEALTGPLKGQRLSRIKSTTSFWFGWKDFHQKTAVYAIEK